MSLVTAAGLSVAFGLLSLGAFNSGMKVIMGKTPQVRAHFAVVTSLWVWGGAAVAWLLF